MYAPEVAPTPTERCSLIARRLRDSFRRKDAALHRLERKQARLRAEKRTPWDFALQRARARRDQIESEREAWLRAICEHRGNMKLIAKHMGYAERTSSKVVWDLGYWPDLIKARGERP